MLRGRHLSTLTAHEPLLTSRLAHAAPVMSFQTPPGPLNDFVRNITFLQAASHAVKHPVPALQVAFVRDITAYIGASCLVLAFLWDGWLSLAESLVLVLLYIGYVVIACYTST